MTGAWDTLKLLGAVTDSGETFVLPCKDNFTGDLTLRFLDALQTEFGEKLCIVLDNATYFTAKKVQEYAEDSHLELCYFPRGSTRVNPAEEYWRLLNQALGNRLFNDLDALRDAALAALESIEPPSVFTYLCP